LGIKKAWDYLNCNQLLLQAGIRKRSGIPVNNLAFNYTTMPLIDAKSISKASELVNNDKLLNALGLGYNQCTLNRFINARWDWTRLNELRVTALQQNSLTKASVNGLLIIDDTIIHKFGKCMENVEWVYDPTIPKSVLGYDLLVLHYVDDSKSYPISFAFKLKTNNRIQLAAELATRAVQLGVGTKYVTFDAFYFAVELITSLDGLGLYWVTKSKSNRKFLLNGETVNARQIIEQGIDEATAWLPDYGEVKLVRAKINKDWHLLVTNDLDMPKEQVIKIYRKRFSIDNPFFRDSKQEVGLTNFHMRKFSGIVGHVAMTFLAWALLSVLKLLNRRLSSKTTGWIKEKFVQVVARVRRTGRRIAIVLNKAHRWMRTILKPPPE